MIATIRKNTPLWVRQKIGPVISYVLYVLRIRFGVGRPNVQIMNIRETLDYILKNQPSVIRYGDGEITLIDGGDLLFQKNSPPLSRRLEEIFRSNEQGLLICATDIWGNLDSFEPYARTFNMHQAYRMGPVWRRLFTAGKVYGETNITRHYLGYKDKSQAGDIFKKIFNIWKDQEVVLIEGEKSRLGVGNDLFSNTKKLERILCPAENAFFSYEKILETAKKINKDNLILLSLGPTAKILAYDLFLLGFRVVDIGHIDMEYEMFLQKSTKQVKVRYKYFNEIHERDPEDCADETYQRQVIARVV